MRSSIVFLTSFIVATLCGCLEWFIITCSRPDVPFSSNLMAFGLSAVTALHLAVSVSVLYPLLPHNWLSYLRERLRWKTVNVEESLRFSSRGMAIFFVAVTSGAIAALSAQLSHEFIRVDLARTFGGLVGVFSTFFLYFGYRWSQVSMEGWLRKHWFRSAVVFFPVTYLPLTLFAIGAFGIWLVIAPIDLSRWNLERFRSLSVTVIGLFVLLGWIESKRTGWQKKLIVVTICTGISGFLILNFDHEWSLNHQSEETRRTLSAMGLGMLRTYNDRDQDGHASRFGGGDCDDTSPLVGPHAIEIPDDGIDNNCRDGDAKSDKNSTGSPMQNSATEASAKPKFNVLFILIDTVRASRLSLYGHERQTSPHLDKWAKGSIVFERAYAQAPNTPRSLPSLLTGRYPSRVRWLDVYQNYSLPEIEQANMLTYFKKHGWRTQGISAHWYFEKVPQIKSWADAWDNRGFLDVAASYKQITSPEISKRVIEQLNALSKATNPFFIFAHYFDPHAQYHLHQAFADFPIETSADVYDTELKFTDHHLAAVLHRLSESDLKHNTVVVITSDHGEAFKEHGLEFHGRTLYEEEIRVPLVIYHPNLEPRVITTPVGLIDVFSTLADIHGGSPRVGDGESLLPLMSGLTRNRSQPLFTEQLPYPSFKEYLVAGLDPKSSDKVIYDLTGQKRHFFNLTDDPSEKKPDPSPNNASQKELESAIGRFLEALRP